MKAIILAAGRGSRMKNKTEALPKCLMKLWNKTLLEWQLNSLTESGISDIAIVTGYRAEEIMKCQPHLKYFHNDIWDKTNMVSTLLQADEWLKNDECIVSYADIIYTANAVKLLINNKDNIAITYYTKFLELWKNRFDNPLDDIETFKKDESFNLTEIGGKAQSLEDIEGQYMGLLKFTPYGWSKIYDELQSNNLPKSISKIDMTTLLSHLLSRNIKIKAIPYNEIFLEVDNPNDLELYESWNLKSI